MERARVIAFLNTGRCGTQWLTAGLRELYPSIDVEHEPIGPLYRPRHHFRCYATPDKILEIPEVATHMRRIESSSRPYVETGWPLFAALPTMAARLGGRIRIVHLTRHPIPSALSHLAHKSYAGSPRDDAYTQLATLGPDDARIFQGDYSERWDHLSPYEKCLFWWTEVHRFGLEVPRRLHGVPFLRIKSEDVLSGETAPLERLLDFMGLPWTTRWIGRTRQVVDRWHHHTDDDPDPLLIRRHDLAVEVAVELGYDIGAVDLQTLTARYRGRPDQGLDRLGRFA